VPRPRLSFPTRPVHKYECQNDVVQHVHPRRLNFKPRFLFIPKEGWAVELGDHRLVVEGHQLHAVVERRENGKLECFTFGRFIPDAPSAHLY